MLKLLDKIFGGPKRTEAKSIALSQNVKPQSLEELFLKHLIQSSYFRQDSIPMVLKHLKREIDRNKSGKKLTASEKSDLGINTRLSITSDLVSSLSAKGLQLSDPKYALKQVYYRATFEARRLEDFKKMLSVGIREVTYNSCSNDIDCAWCEANNGVKFPLTEGINAEINQNCTCDWNKGFFTPEIDLTK
ncbi:hypothetical protein ABF162_25340 (plasmid) [Vibrio coralliilyticus]|uniref:hypothetical protein n=1 Tax=Vibrio coralliilyticus TaxID=190893 RepID=UPI0005128D84|nr:hypothetical protein [Vibrio coralliilyticus]AIS58338.1 hypothetical protein JV59_25300 [Vibrio coralliilyticus]